MLVHWCMCMAAYPFFGTVADAARAAAALAGNSRGGPDTAPAPRTPGRTRDRRPRRAPRPAGVHRLGVLRETGKKGLYRGAAKRAAGDGSITVWVLKAMLSAGGGEPRPPSALLRAPPPVPVRDGVAFDRGDGSLRRLRDRPARARSRGAARPRRNRPEVRHGGAHLTAFRRQRCAVAQWNSQVFRPQLYPTDIRPTPGGDDHERATTARRPFVDKLEASVSRIWEDRRELPSLWPSGGTPLAEIGR